MTKFSVSDTRVRNLGLLVAVRRGYYVHELHPIRLGTHLANISEDLRLSAVKAVLPLVPEGPRGVLDLCIKYQSERPWNLDYQTSPWSSLKIGEYGPGMADIDDLTSLEYDRLFDGIVLPSGIIPGKILASVEDYLVNDISILECLRLVEYAIKKLADDGPPPAGRVLSFEELRIHLHSTTAVVRLRAGWDKMLNNVLRNWFGPHEGKWPNEWPKRIARLDREIQMSAPEVLPFWKDWKRNATEISKDRGLRSIRDSELHYWGLRTRETFGSGPRAVSLRDLTELVLMEHRRLVDAWLLAMAMIRSGTDPE